MTQEISKIKSIERDVLCRDYILTWEDGSKTYVADTDAPEWFGTAQKVGIPIPKFGEASR